VRLGVSTDTQDPTGSVIGGSASIPPLPEIQAALERFRGAIRQRPPLYSAVKVAGTRLYKAARRGLDVERGERTVHVYRLELLEASLPEITLDLTVSRGTYVRTIAHELGAILGCGAHLSALRRIESGPFGVDAALSCDRRHGHDAAAFRSRALSLDQALSFLPRARLHQDEAVRLRHGRAPALNPERIEEPRNPWPLPPGEPGRPLALTEPGGGVLALAAPWETQTPGEPVRLLRVLVGA
jgi:tRNA pseudouridine55 synthase